MKAKFTAPEEKDEFFDAPAPVETPKAKTPEAKAPEPVSPAEQREAAKRAHAAAVQAQTLAEIEADSALRDFSTRFTELMSTAPRTDEEVDAAYALAQKAHEIAEDKAMDRAQAQAEVHNAQIVYLNAYYVALVAERKAD